MLQWVFLKLLRTALKEHISIYSVVIFAKMRSNSIVNLQTSAEWYHHHIVNKNTHTEVQKPSQFIATFPFIPSLFIFLLHRKLFVCWSNFAEQFSPLTYIAIHCIYKYSIAYHTIPAEKAFASQTSIMLRKKLTMYQ